MRISDLVNKVETFRFEYDVFVLEGEWYKYRTTTPSYAKKSLEGLPEIPEGGTEEEQQAAEKARDKALADVGFQALADTIKSWNAEDDDGNALPPSREVFEQLPNTFTNKFLEFLGTLRDGASPANGSGNPTQPSSPTT